MGTMHRKLAVFASVFIVAGSALAGTTAYKSQLVVRSSDTNPACATSGTTDGYLCAEGGIESEGVLNVAGASTLTGATTITGAATLSSTATVAGATTLNGAVVINGAYTRPAAYTITFDEGASKGLALLKFDGTAYSTTAAVHNILYYGGQSLSYVTITAATATLTPTADANGVDLMVGGGDNDLFEMHGGTYGVSGRPFTVGTDAAFKMCVTIKFHDVSGSDGFFCGFRTMDVPVTIASYTDYAAIGNVSGTINVTDKTTGNTSTTDSWADDAAKTLCTLVSAAGVVTYTNGGAAPTATDAHTLGDGLSVIPFCQGIENTDLADDTWIQSWSVSFQ